MFDGIIVRLRNALLAGRGKERRMLHAVDTFAAKDGGDGGLDYLLFQAAATSMRPV